MVDLTVNTTHLPDREVRRLVRFARPHGLRTVEVELGRTQERYVADSYPHAALVRVRVGFQHRFPYVHRHSCADLRRGYLSWGLLASATELLVALLAHELRHCWQAQRGWAIEGRASETDADQYALAVLARWRAG